MSNECLKLLLLWKGLPAAGQEDSGFESCSVRQGLGHHLPTVYTSLLRISPEKHPVDPRKSRSPEAQHSWSPAATFPSIFPSYHPSPISSLPPPTTHTAGILRWKVLGSSKGSPGCCPSSGLLSVGDLQPSAAMTLGLGTRIIQFIFLLSFKGQWGTWASGKPPDSQHPLRHSAKSKEVAWD